MRFTLFIFCLLIFGYFFQADAQIIQHPFTGSPITLPAQIEAENYDRGGQGIAYYDTDELNQGNAYRIVEDVDIEVCSEGGYMISYIATGEWMEYTVNVLTTSTYKLEIRTASDQASCAIRLDMDGTPVTAAIELPKTKGWQNWSTTTVPAVTLAAGEHVLRLFVVTGGFNLNSFTLSNLPPVVSIIAPSNGTMFTAPASFSINVNATDLDGTVTKVEFYNGATLLGSSAAAPYTFNWSNVQEGKYMVTAKATDNVGNATVSSPVVLTVMTMVIPNQPPNVTLTNPVNNTTANAPSTILISADAADSDGTVSRVEFYNGSLLIGVDRTAPYNYYWVGVGAGVYKISAKAFDDKDASKTSAAAVVTVLAVVTDVCMGLPKYIENGGYAAGNKVKNGSGRYECKGWPFSAWCNGAAWAYAPGEGAYWSDAWNLLGTCGNSRSSETKESTEDVLVLTASPNPFQGHTTLSLVLKESGDVSIQVYDKYGVLIQKLSEGYQAEGSHDFALNLAREKTGFYLIKCVTSNGSMRSQMIKME
ncbi:MAG: Carbohydrate binding family 6 [Cytophagaceae bacterium]|jgi:hypothetical protein|nr:Carbohydrate binding family 6 [Cytophagaceae bacterium]